MSGLHPFSATFDSSPLVVIAPTDPLSRALYEELFGDYGIRLRFLEPAEDLIKVLQQRPADLIILNFENPVFNGCVQCRRLREVNELNTIPVLMVTARDDREARLEALRAGADDFIGKPFDLDELEARVRTILKANRYRRMTALHHRFVEVAERLPQGLLILEPPARVVFANALAREWFRFADSAELPTDFRSHCAPWFEFQTDYLSYFRQLLSPPFKEIVLVENHDSEMPPRWFSCKASALDTTADGRLLIFVEEITRQARMSNLNWSLRTILNHKLRTPLNGILGPLEFLQEATTLSQEDMEMLDIAQHSAKRLSNTLGNLMEYLETTDTTRFQTSTKVEELAELFEAVCLQMEVAPPLLTLANLPSHCCVHLPGHVAEAIFSELVANSRKFHPASQPQMELEILWDATRESVTLAVRDDGPGLPEEDLANALIPFYQVDPHTTGEIPGEGLGLSRINQLLWPARGNLRLRNRRERKGLTVLIELRSFFSDSAEAAN